MKNIPKILIISTLLLVVHSYYTQVNGKYFFALDNTIPVSKSGSDLLSPFAGGLNSAQCSKINLNNDSYEDLFVFDRTGNSILTYLWDPTENDWVFDPSYIEQFPSLSYWAILRDYNCDGKKDIFSYVNGGVGVWKNTSTVSEISFEYVSEPYVKATLLGGTEANLYVSKVDIPDINDIDGDGDLDVLTFGILGARIEYYLNTSVENGFGCDSLHYEIANTCWGHFLETGTNTNKCILKDTCDANNNVASPKGAKHSGSTVLTLDLNDDGVKDLLLGDVSFKNVVALFNDSKGVNQNTSLISQDTAFPSNTQSVDLQVFPAGFYEDYDEDGIKDLVFSPNTDNATENFESLWLYKNYGTNTNPLFSHIKNNFLQEQMIDVGSNAYPVLFDYNDDGLLDLFIGNFGYYDFNDPNLYKGRIALYENVGTSASPSFEWITDDFASISSAGFTSGIYPTFGDIDNDGDIDMIIGDFDGFLHLYLNSSSNSSQMNLSLTTVKIEDHTNTDIDVGYHAKPNLFDIDNDGDLDLIIGEENGNLNYYENTGTASAYTFRLQSDTFGDIDVSEWWTTIGKSTPTVFENSAGETQIFVAAENGQIHHYNNIDNNLGGVFTEVDTNFHNLKPVVGASATIGYLNDDNLLDMIIGNERGGIHIYYGSDDISLSNNEMSRENHITIYPNPTNDNLNLQSEETIIDVQVFDTKGSLIPLTFNDNKVNTNLLPAGVYIILVNTNSISERQVFIKR